MATVGPRAEDDQLQLLTEWGDAFTLPRRKRAGVASVMVHAALIAVLLLLPADFLTPPQEPPPPERHVTVTPLIAPPLTEFTQKDPTKGKVSHEIDTANLQPRPKIQTPQGPPPAPPGKPKPTPAPPVQAAAPQPAAPLPEPPKTEATARETPKVDLPPGPSPQQPVQPQIQTTEKPKLALENVGSAPPPVPPGGTGKVPVPSGSVTDAIQNMRSGTSAGGAYVGDPGALPGVGESINQPPGPGVPGSALQLKSDPMGVDFQPYLRQILIAIKTNWLAVYPEAARLGQRGRVKIIFSLNKRGAVGNVDRSVLTGTNALERAAWAAISASNPFPPLPPEFKGNSITLEVNFVYNMPRR